MANINTWPGWEPVRKLGEGGFGSVYEIQRQDYGVTYRAALKVISVPVSESDVDQKRSMGMDDASVGSYFNSCVEKMAKEVALMASMKGNSNIVSYEDHMVVERQDAFGWNILIRMELLTPLQKHVADHPMDEAEVIRLGLDLCRALELCQRKHILHRDIKPDNIFVNDNGDYKLGDFGISRTIEQSQGNYTNKAGTFYYMAPEVFNGQEYGRSADLDSLGIVLYQYLNERRLPFLPQGTITMADIQTALVQRMGGEEIPAPVHGSDALKRVVLKCIAHRPENRYQSAGELSEALHRCQSGWNRPLERESPPRPEPQPQPEQIPPEPESIRDKPDSQADFYAPTPLLFESEQTPRREAPAEPEPAPEPQGAASFRAWSQPQPEHPANHGLPIVSTVKISQAMARYGGRKACPLAGSDRIVWADIPAGVANLAKLPVEVDGRQGCVVIEVEAGREKMPGFIYLGYEDYIHGVWRILPTDDGRGTPRQDGGLARVHVLPKMESGQRLDVTVNSTGEQLRWFVLWDTHHMGLLSISEREARDGANILIPFQEQFRAIRLQPGCKDGDLFHYCHDDSHRLLRWKVRVFPDTPPAGMPMDAVLPLTENEAKYGCYKSVRLAGDRKTLWVNVPENTANGRVFTIQEKENGPVFYIRAKVSPVQPAEGRGMIVLAPDETGLLYRRMPRDSGRSHPSDDTVMIWVEIPANAADGQLIDTTSTSTGERLQWRVIRGSKLQQPANRDRFEVHHSRFGDVFTVKDQNRAAGASGNADESTITISASQAKKGFKLWYPRRNGKGLVVTIPAGIKDGETVRVRKLNILLHIRVSAGEVRYSERDGSDVAHAIPVKLSKSQAQNGTTISVQPPAGVRAQFNIPAGVENGVILQCRGKDGGMKYLLVSVGWF